MAPAGPRVGVPFPASGPLDGTGVGLLELLATEDALLARPDTEPVALEVGLERARGALLRQMPTDALASLDAVWEGARRTEEGWYLRGGALLALGLPGEGDRVVNAGVEARPASNALRFLQSLSRLTLGDIAGARHALGAAQRRLPADPLLTAQQAVLAAEGGDQTRADELLHAAARRLPDDHPVLEYARESVRAALAARSRDGGIAVELPSADVRSGADPVDAPADVPVPGGANGTANGRSRVTPDGAAEPDRIAPMSRESASRDPVSQAVHLLGGRVAVADATMLEREARALLAAFSAGGALAGTAPAPQLHGARALLVTILSVLGGEESDASPVFRTLVESVLAAVRGGAPDEAARVLRRTGAVTREPTMALLHELVRGALVAVQRTPGSRAPETSAAFGTDAAFGAVDGGAVRGDVERSVLLPLRLGLRLLDESRESRAAIRTAAPARRPEGTGRAGAPGEPAVDQAAAYSLAPTLSSLRAVSPEPGSWAEIVPIAPQGGTHARLSERAATIDDGAERERERLADGRGPRLVAIACVLLAAVAGTAGHPAFAVAFGVGAAWLAIRRSEGDRTGQSDRNTDHRTVARRAERPRTAPAATDHEAERIG